jgi:hypothetical protein
MALAVRRPASTHELEDSLHLNDVAFELARRKPTNVPSHERTKPMVSRISSRTVDARLQISCDSIKAATIKLYTVQLSQCPPQNPRK